MADVAESLAVDLALDRLELLVEYVEFGSNNGYGYIWLLHFGYLILNFRKYRHLLPIVDEARMNLLEHLQSVCL